MLTSAKDIFWLSLSLAVIWVAVFTGWGMFYVAMILRDAKRVTGSMRQKIDFVDRIFGIFKKKAENSASYIPPLVEGATKIMEAISEKRKTDKKKRK